MLSIVTALSVANSIPVNGIPVTEIQPQDSASAKIWLPKVLFGSTVLHEYQWITYWLVCLPAPPVLVNIQYEIHIVGFHSFQSMHSSGQDLPTMPHGTVG